MIPDDDYTVYEVIGDGAYIRAQMRAGLPIGYRVLEKCPYPLQKSAYSASCYDSHIWAVDFDRFEELVNSWGDLKPLELSGITGD